MRCDRAEARGVGEADEEEGRMGTTGDCSSVSGAAAAGPVRPSLPRAGGARHPWGCRAVLCSQGSIVTPTGDHPPHHTTPHARHCPCAGMAARLLALLHCKRCDRCHRSLCCAWLWPSTYFTSSPNPYHVGVLAVIEKGVFLLYC
jgi:hypothetical protein